MRDMMRDGPPMPDLPQLLVVVVKAGGFFSHSRGFKVNTTASRQPAQGLHKSSCAKSFRHGQCPDRA